MADAADRADIVIQRATENAISKIKVPDPADGRPNCKHCEDDIPAARQALGYQTCVECQELVERGVL